MVEVSHCPFCSIPENQGDACPLENKILLLDEPFFMLPAIGPLVVGHTMLVSRRHGLGVIREPPEDIASYLRLVSSLRQALSADGHMLVEVEHGGVSVNGMRACITHTHVHLLPDLPQLISAFDHLPDFSGTTRTYVRIDNGSERRLKDAATLPGQGVRRIIGSLVGDDAWDWAAFPKSDMLEESVRWWRRIL